MLKPVLIVICVVALITYSWATLSAVGSARNRNYFGLARILTGWWLYSPYEDDGDIPSKVGIVRTARVSWFVALGTFVAIMFVE
jgi:hypothetical protein